MALNEFEGTVMLVSHDRALLREVCDEFWLVTDGAVKPYDGDLDDYQKWLLEQSREASREQAKGDKAKRRRHAAADAAAVATPVSSVPAPTASVATAPAAPTAAGRASDDRKSGAAARQQRSDELKPLRKELSGIDSRLAALHGDRAKVEIDMAADGLTPAQRAEQGKRLKQIGDETEALEARWLELSTRLDAPSIA